MIDENEKSNIWYDLQHMQEQKWWHSQELQIHSLISLLKSSLPPFPPSCPFQQYHVFCHQQKKTAIVSVLLGVFDID